MQLLGGLSPREFLDQYWQKRPLVIRSAIPELQSPLSPEELAGLACEEVEARLVRGNGTDKPWEYREGPFEAEDFTSLPERDWTLLVQGVDRLMPEVAELVAPFRFFPNWRLDDVMVSYAAPGGSVGPHVDQYDVFLLQGLGQRRWQVEREPVEEEVLRPDTELRVLARFAPDEEWVLEPGDMLYLPPGLAHHGTAVDRCMTFSVGFRAPDDLGLLAGYAENVMRSLDPTARYKDPDLEPRKDPGRLEANELERVRRSVRRFGREDRDVDRWFAAFISEPKPHETPAPLDPPFDGEELLGRLGEGDPLLRSAVPHFVYIPRVRGGARMFVGGTEYELDADHAGFAQLVTGREPLGRETLSRWIDRSEARGVLLDLVNRGFLYFED
ncbi:hypothetical protein ABI59_13560 [Acidobacteria bacterium Mor1]|nr:hypothetical protein ABI59_13560 [Acidobacteria bacterium Mor1]